MGSAFPAGVFCFLRPPHCAPAPALYGSPTHGAAFSVPRTLPEAPSLSPGSSKELHPVLIFSQSLHLPPSGEHCQNLPSHHRSLRTAPVVSASHWTEQAPDCARSNYKVLPSIRSAPAQTRLPAHSPSAMTHPSPSDVSPVSEVTLPPASAVHLLREEH